MMAFRITARQACGLVLAIVTAVPATGHGYRPFDSTDAAVAAKGELEIELGPVGYLRENGRHYLVLPGVIFNLGLPRGWELVLQGRHVLLLGDRADEPRSRLLDTGFFVKGVLRDGTLQDSRGPSIAVEVGVLLPTVNADAGWGASGALIVSQRWRLLTLHANIAGALTRSEHFDLLGGLIVEGPAAWRVRPVAEIVVEREFDVSFVYSGLLGAIWRVTEHLSFDAAGRVARSAGANIYEIRAGVTWSFGVCHSS